MRLTPSQLSALIEELDWTRVREIEVRAPIGSCASFGLLLRVLRTD